MYRERENSRRIGDCSKFLIVISSSIVNHELLRIWKFVMIKRTGTLAVFFSFEVRYKNNTNKWQTTQQPISFSYFHLVFSIDWLVRFCHLRKPERMAILRMKYRPPAIQPEMRVAKGKLNL
jgi:hypothetical protein